MAIDPTALLRLYESESHAIGEMLTVIGVPDEDRHGNVLSLRQMVRWLIDRERMFRVEAERLKMARDACERQFQEKVALVNMLEGDRDYWRRRYMQAFPGPPTA